MAISVIDKELLKYFTQLDEEQKQSLLELIKTFIKPNKQAPKTSIEEYNKELDAAMERINNGQFTTLEELENEMKTW
ncbi:MAG: hypothetical protein K2X48_10010 [Chitinophagaceae bacterium]|nr:hypothetical protein [Chitinophagaceae bacterium]